MILLQPAITLRRLFQRLLGGVLLINLATGDDALRRTVLSPQAHQSPALHLVGEVAVHQSQAPICSLGSGEKLGLIILLLLLHFGEVLFDLASERREVVD